MKKSCSFIPITYPVDTAIGLPNCGIISVASATHKSYKETLSQFQSVIGYRKNWKGRTYIFQLEKVLDSMGYLFREVTVCHRQKIINIISYLEKNKIYIIRVGQHFMAVQNGFFVDQSGVLDTEDLKKEWYDRKRITHIFLIEKKVL